VINPFSFSSFSTSTSNRLKREKDSRFSCVETGRQAVTWGLTVSERPQATNINKPYYPLPQTRTLTLTGLSTGRTESRSLFFPTTTATDPDALSTVFLRPRPSRTRAIFISEAVAQTTDHNARTGMRAPGPLFSLLGPGEANNGRGSSEPAFARAAMGAGPRAAGLGRVDRETAAQIPIRPPAPTYRFPSLSSAPLALHSFRLHGG
jgi:hypothetical protein